MFAALAIAAGAAAVGWTARGVRNKIRNDGKLWTTCENERERPGQPEDLPTYEMWESIIDMPSRGEIIEASSESDSDSGEGSDDPTEVRLRNYIESEPPVKIISAPPTSVLMNAAAVDRRARRRRRDRKPSHCD